jgi:hypothetical protein
LFDDGTVGVLPISPTYRRFVDTTRADWRTRLGPILAGLLGRVAFEMVPLSDKDLASLSPAERAIVRDELRRLREHRDVW